MYFLVDYENVNYMGLEGTEFLERKDNICIFYSEVCNTIQAYHLNNIKKSGCEFDICKLVKIRDNALDYYIASKVGEIFAIDENARIAIISNDRGFLALMDYWKTRLKKSQCLVKASSIIKSISCLCGRRKKNIDERMAICCLQYEFQKFKEEMSVCDVIEEEVLKVIGGEKGRGITRQIVEIMKKSDGLRMLYINMIREIGKIQGIELYRGIKEKYIELYEE